VGRCLAVLAVVAACAAAAAPAHADRAGPMAVLATGASRWDVQGGVALDDAGRWTTVWAPRGSGTLRLARQTPGGLERRVVRDDLRGLEDADVALTMLGEPVVVWADTVGVWAQRPFVDDAPVPLASGRGQAARVVRLADGRLAAYAVVGQGSRSRLALAVGDGATWQVRTLGSVRRIPRYSSFDLAATAVAGVAMLRTERGRLRLETLVDAGGSAQPSVVDLGIARSGAGLLASTGGGGVHVLYGGIAPGARTGSLRYGLLDRAGHFTRRVLLRDLQCDAAANQVGIGLVGDRVRLLYGYGCDIGWAIASTRGRTVLDPLHDFRAPSVQVPAFAGSGGGRIAVVGRDTRGRLGVQVIAP
jgi:ketosteroid isomerase-like protein